MLNYKLLPSYEYQEDPWLTYRWKKHQTSEQKSPGKKSGLASAVRSVNLSNILMKEARSRRIPVTVLYATETGRSERFAYQLSETLDQCFQPRVIRMDNYDINCLRDEVLICFVISTFGDGEPPANGIQFMNSLKELQLQAESTKSLRHIRFAVFGLGSRAYPQFCSVGHNVDKSLLDLGLQRIHKVGEGDHLKGQENGFNQWARSVFKAACDEMGMQLQETDADDFHSIATIASQLRLIAANKGEDADEVNSAIAEIHNKSVVEVKVIGNENLQSPDSDRRTILVKMSNDDVGEHKQIVHEAGDHVGIFPTNDEAMVKKILDRVIFSNLSADEVIAVEVRRQNKWEPDNRLPATTVRTALTHFLDITTPLDQMLIEILSNLATEEAEASKLKSLAQDIQKYEEWSTNLYMPLDVFLEEFKSVDIPAALLLNQLPLLQPRYYSMSSSLLSHPKEIQVTVSVVEFNAGVEGKGPRRSGLCSSWLEERKCGDKVLVFHRKVENFYLPEDTSLPIIMVGPGTGLAPFMAFVDKRKGELKNKNLEQVYGDMSLYFGCRRSDQDQIYKTEIESLVNDGVVSQYNVALSREPRFPKTYVQDLILRDTTDIYHQIVDKDGHFYICGDINMAAQVEDAIKLILSLVGKMSSKEADDYIQMLCNLNRYHKDIYGFKVTK